jgi:polyisoprenoid-binding protein YceI
MRRSLKVLIAAVVVVAAAGGVGLWWFFKDDAPDEVSLDSAVDSVTTTTGDGTGSTVAVPDGIEGLWTVDATTGEFDFESATGTFAGFRIEEELAGVGSTTAVGRTGAVTGTMVIAGTTVTEASFEVDLTGLTTNESRRDDRVQQALETGAFPTATFVLTEPIDLGADAASGGAVTVTAAGDLTNHGVTKAIELPIEAQLVGGTIVVVGSTDIVFSDYGVEVPDAQIVLSVEDHGVLELQLLLTKER